MTGPPRPPIKPAIAPMAVAATTVVSIGRDHRPCSTSQERPEAPGHGSGPLAWAARVSGLASCQAFGPSYGRWNDAENGTSHEWAPLLDQRRRRLGGDQLPGAAEVVERLGDLADPAGVTAAGVLLQHAGQRADLGDGARVSGVDGSGQDHAFKDDVVRGRLGAGNQGGGWRGDDREDGRLAGGLQRP